MNSRRNMVLYRVNCDFTDIKPAELAEYFANIDKRNQWDSAAYDEVK